MTIPAALRWTGAELRAALDALGLTQTEFAVYAGLHEQTISKYVRGALDVPLIVQRVAELLREVSTKPAE